MQPSYQPAKHAASYREPGVHRSPRAVYSANHYQRKVAGTGPVPTRPGVKARVRMRLPLSSREGGRPPDAPLGVSLANSGVALAPSDRPADRSAELRGRGRSGPGSRVGCLVAPVHTVDGVLGRSPSYASTGRVRRLAAWWNAGDREVAGPNVGRREARRRPSRMPSLTRVSQIPF
ncbi:hypothetical protein HPB47_006245 [Ixodes persulcatus]|uniref:Uncharacterized protein n=1 Tax=Ixodes persulcatus TaxID=34615 RepID=A0AC60PAY3_IXOPE|nr:hypothetical protein HPB47_006245 [Ixodes persulcatus]